MAQFTFYKSTDASAPVLTGQAGSLISVLDACLVDGYGAKTAAGWAKAFTGTNQAAYRAPAGNRLYLSVYDDASGTGGAKEASVRCFEVMTSISGGAKSANDINTPSVWRKSDSADATARKWIVVADTKTVYVFIETGANGVGIFQPFMFGEIYSFVPGDAFNTMLVAKDTANDASTGYVTRVNTVYSQYGMFLFSGNVTYLNSHMNCTWIARGWAQSGSGTRVGLTHASPFGVFGNYYGYSNPPGWGYPAGGLIRYTSGGNIIVGSIYIYEYGSTYANGVMIRGKYRGLYLWLHGVDRVNHGDTFTVTGKSFEVIKVLVSADINSPYVSSVPVMVETSDTVED